MQLEMDAQEVPAHLAEFFEPVPGLKPKDLIGIPFRVAFALQEAGWYLRSDIIWCLSGGTRVYARTQKGEMPTTIKDLVRLDPSTVQLWNGEKWTQVLGWSETPRPETSIEIELRSGERVGCTNGHEWPTQRGLVRADDLRIGDVIKTCRLPEAERPRYPSALDDKAVGWFVGLYLAEGSRSDTTIQIAGHTKETERFNRLCALADAYHGTCRVHQMDGFKAAIHLYGPILNGIIDTYIGGRTAKDKHLNMRCWQRSDAFLSAVLEGYLSGDGHWDEANQRWRFGFTQNDSLAADLRTIAARLGYSIRLKRTIHTMNDRSFPGWRGQLRITRSLHMNNKQDGEIVAIRASRARKFWDIGVADEPHLFALASGVLTHNSKGNPMPESVTDRPTKSHEYIFLLAKAATYYYDQDAIREPLTLSTIQRDKSPRGRRQNGGGSVESMTGIEYTLELGNMQSNPNGRNRRSVWNVNTVPFKGAHFATFPPKLIEPCILAGVPQTVCSTCGNPHVRTTTGFNPTCSHGTQTEPGTVIDPFAGAGTTGVVAKQHGRRAILIEQNESYCRMAADRIAKIEARSLVLVD